MSALPLRHHETAVKAARLDPPAGAEVIAVGKAVLGYRHAPARTRRLPSHQAGRMHRRQGELRRFIAEQLAHWVVIENPAGVLAVAADTLAFVGPGIDFIALAEIVGRSFVETYGDQMAMAAIHRVAQLVDSKGARYRPIRGDTAGRMIGLTRADREELGISTMDAVDEPREERERRRAAERRRRDSLRARQKRQAAGVRSRAEYEADSVAALCRKLGISRPTYYRRRNAGCPIEEWPETAKLTGVTGPSAAKHRNTDGRRTCNTATEPDGAPTGARRPGIGGAS